MKNLAKARAEAQENPNDLQAQIEWVQAIAQYLDVTSMIGEKSTEGSLMKEQGRELQKAGKRIKELAPVGTHFSTFGELYELRGIGYEGEGLLTEMFGKTKAIAAGIVPRFVRLAKDLTKIKVTAFPDVSAAHGVKVQAMIYLGRFNYRLPKPLKDLKRSIFWLKEAIVESPKNPVLIAQKKPPIQPLVPRIFLIESLAESASETNGEIQTLFEEIDLLQKQPLSHYEDYLAGYISEKVASLSSLRSKKVTST